METSLITLYGKAIDARMSPTILGDEMAVHAIKKIDYDFSRLKAMNQAVEHAEVKLVSGRSAPAAR